MAELYPQVGLLPSAHLALTESTAAKPESKRRSSASTAARMLTSAPASAALHLTIVNVNANALSVASKEPARARRMYANVRRSAIVRAATATKYLGSAPNPIATT